MQESKTATQLQIKHTCPFIGFRSKRALGNRRQVIVSSTGIQHLIVAVLDERMISIRLRNQCRILENDENAHSIRFPFVAILHRYVVDTR